MLTDEISDVDEKIKRARFLIGRINYLLNSLFIIIIIIKIEYANCYRAM